MTKPGNILAAELHESAARAHQIAAALSRQGRLPQCVALAVAALADSVKAHRASALAADHSLTSAAQDAAAPHEPAVENGPGVLVKFRDEPQESLGQVVRLSFSRRQRRPWALG